MLCKNGFLECFEGNNGGGSENRIIDQSEHPSLLIMPYLKTDV